MQASQFTLQLSFNDDTVSRRHMLAKEGKHGTRRRRSTGLAHQAYCIPAGQRQRTPTRRAVLID